MANSIHAVEKARSVYINTRDKLKVVCSCFDV